MEDAKDTGRLSEDRIKKSSLVATYRAQAESAVWQLPRN